MGRKRYGLVPEGAVEAFECRQVLYFDEHGRAMIQWDVDKPDHSGGSDIAIHEILGVMTYSMILMVCEHLGIDVGDDGPPG